MAEHIHFSQVPTNIKHPLPPLYCRPSLPTASTTITLLCPLWHARPLLTTRMMMYVAHSHRAHPLMDDLLIPLNQANGIVDVDHLQSHGIPAPAIDVSLLIVMARYRRKRHQQTEGCWLLDDSSIFSPALLQPSSLKLLKTIQAVCAATRRNLSKIKGIHRTMSYLDL